MLLKIYVSINSHDLNRHREILFPALANRQNLLISADNTSAHRTMCLF